MGAGGQCFMAVSDFYIVVVFRDYAERTAFLASVGWENNRYQAGTALQALLFAELDSHEKTFVEEITKKGRARSC